MRVFDSQFTVRARTAGLGPRMALCGALCFLVGCGSGSGGVGDAGLFPDAGAAVAVDGGAAGVDGGAGGADGGAALVWRAATSLPTPRQEVAAAVLRGAIHVIGGLDGRGRGIRETLRYEPNAATWTRVADYPFAADHALAVTVGERIYVMGGSDGFNPNNPERRVFAYDPDLDRWNPRADMPAARWAPSGAAIGNTIYVGGGLGQQPSSIMAYDTTQNSWQILAGVALTPRDHLGAAEVGGRVYFIGGRQGATNVPLVEVLDPAAPRVSTVSPMPTARGGIAATALDGRIYVPGGEDLTGGLGLPGGVYPQLELYEPTRDVWTTGPTMRTPRHGHAMVTLGSLVYAIGGGDRAGLGASLIVETVGF